MKWIEPIVFSKSSRNPIFGQIFGHQRAENEARNTKMYRGQETHTIRVNTRYEMNWANSIYTPIPPSVELGYNVWQICLQWGVHPEVMLHEKCSLLSQSITGPNMGPWGSPCGNGASLHDDVLKWKHFLRYWPFVWRIPHTKASDVEL